VRSRAPIPALLPQGTGIWQNAPGIQAKLNPVELNAWNAFLFLCTGIGFLINYPLALLGFACAVLLCLAIGLRNTWLILHRE
jgi:hypothetical protein